MNKANQEVPAAKTKAPKKEKPLVACWCGCGGQTKSKFVPGHDARFHGWAKKAARLEINVSDVLTTLPHKEARDAFLAEVEKEIPKAEARAIADEAKELAKAERATKKAAEKAAKDAAKVVVAAEPAPEPAPVAEEPEIEETAEPVEADAELAVA